MKISICHTGVSSNFIIQKMSSSEVITAARKFQTEAKILFPNGNKIILDLDRLNGFSAVYLKLLGYEKFLKQWPHQKLHKVTGKVIFTKEPPVLVQVLLPVKPDFSSSTVLKARARKVQELADRINSRTNRMYVLILQESEEIDRLALFTNADVLLLTQTRDGISSFPFEFLLAHCANKLNENKQPPPMILSEFTPASRIMLGSLKLNLWKIESIIEALVKVTDMSEFERRARFKTDLSLVKRHTFAEWVVLMLQDLKKARDFHKVLPAGFGFGHLY